VDPDLGGPKTFRSAGSGSATLLFSISTGTWNIDPDSGSIIKISFKNLLKKLFSVLRIRIRCLFDPWIGIGDPRSGKPGIQGSKRHRIPDPEHW
jgi:hypothetical protein